MIAVLFLGNPLPGAFETTEDSGSRNFVIGALVAYYNCYVETVFSVNGMIRQNESSRH